MERKEKYPAREVKEANVVLAFGYITFIYAIAWAKEYNM